MSAPPIITLGDLSNELLYAIVDCVPTWIDAQDQDHPERRHVGPLSRLSICSKRLHAIVQPKLYERLIEDPWMGVFAEPSTLPLFKRTPIKTKPSTLPLFLRSLIEKPELAQFMKSYTGYPATHGGSGGTDSSCLVENPATWKLFNVKITEASQDPAEAAKWIKSGRGDVAQWDAMTTLILSLCPNIESSEFSSNAFDNRYYPHPTLYYPILIRYLSHARDRYPTNQAEKVQTHLVAISGSAQ